jgi:hypothetical protein
MKGPLPFEVDTVIVGKYPQPSPYARTLHSDLSYAGGGPASLILSYILHGHIPYYVGKHYDNLLHSRLSRQPNLLNISPDIYSHILSSIRYSSQALPVNTLLDTLIRPNADTQISSESYIEWRYDPAKAVPHVVLAAAPQAGGQWAERETHCTDEIGALSYSEMLSLPGYSFEEHYLEKYGNPLPDFQRPTQAQVAAYYAAYPEKAGVADTLMGSSIVSNVIRTSNGFEISPFGISCKHLVLATGIFNIISPVPPRLSVLKQVEDHCKPLLVVGSGFSAADAIISASPQRKIIHIFQWHPETKQSPLRACHKNAYPEYVGVYRLMKASASPGVSARTDTSVRRRRSSIIMKQRDWGANYEGLPNATIEQAFIQDGRAVASILTEKGTVMRREIGELQYLIGRRGTLDFLDSQLRAEVLDGAHFESFSATDGLISSRTLRAKAEHDLEVAPGVFIIGSLTGDSLVRHAYGACVYAASRIHDRESCQPTMSSTDMPLTTHDAPHTLPTHTDLHIDRKELVVGYTN